MEAGAHAVALVTTDAGNRGLAIAGATRECSTARSSVWAMGRARASTRRRMARTTTHSRTSAATRPNPAEARCPGAGKEQNGNLQCAAPVHAGRRGPGGVRRVRRRDGRAPVTSRPMDSGERDRSVPRRRGAATWIRGRTTLRDDHERPRSSLGWRPGCLRRALRGSETRWTLISGGLAKGVRSVGAIYEYLGQSLPRRPRCHPTALHRGYLLPRRTVSPVATVISVTGR